MRELENNANVTATYCQSDGIRLYVNDSQQIIEDKCRYLAHKDNVKAFFPPLPFSA